MAFSLLSLLFGGVSTLAANSPDSFQVEVSPSSADVNQFLDITITAIKNGQVMKNYDGKFWMSLEENGSLLSAYDATLPDDGLGSMALTNQGKKVYSKGLSLKKSGTFTLKVEDLFNENSTGETVLTIRTDGAINYKKIELLSPLQNGKETDSVINVMANAPELVNSRMQVYLNGLMVKEGMTDASGLFNETIPLTKVWTNVLELKSVSITNQIVGLSEKRTFVYEALSDALFKSIAMTPNNNLKLGDKVKFEIFTDDRVSSAKLLFSGGQEYPLDKEKDWLFTKEIMLNVSGENVLGLELTASTQRKSYENILSFSVKDALKIWEVRLSLNPKTASTIDLEWATLWGESKDYAVKYGLTRDNLAWVVFTKEPKASLSGFSYGKTYFFQILATTSEHVPEGVPSEVVQFDLPILGGTGSLDMALTGGLLTTDEPHGTAILDQPLCFVKNIQVSTKKIGNKYYLVWDKVKNVEKYLVYRSEFADGSDRKFVGETEIPRFEYPFDKTSKEDVYAYYSVEAVCQNGDKLVLTEAEKVKVGPLEDMLVILAATFLLYLMYKLYIYRV